MTDLEILPITVYYADNSHDDIADALYEFATNAMDANQGNVPEVRIQDCKIVISDGGIGMERKHIITFGRSSVERDPNRHGSHGIGLKDAIACCVRNNCILEIKSKDKCFTFGKAMVESVPYVSLRTKNIETTPGTVVSIQYPNAINLDGVMMENDS